MPIQPSVSPLDGQKIRGPIRDPSLSSVNLCVGGRKAKKQNSCNRIVANGKCEWPSFFSITSSRTLALAFILSHNKPFFHFFPLLSLSLSLSVAFTANLVLAYRCLSFRLIFFLSSGLFHPQSSLYLHLHETGTILIDERVSECDSIVNN